MKANTVHHVVILGCGRSGTSIFGELFEHLEPYTYFSEPFFAELLEFDFSRPIAVKVNDWGHHPKPPDWRDWLERPLIERCAHHWNYINSLGYKKIRALARVKHFEAMIQSPRRFA